MCQGNSPLFFCLAFHHLYPSICMCVAHVKIKTNRENNNNNNKKQKDDRKWIHKGMGMSCRRHVSLIHTMVKNRKMEKQQTNKKQETNQPTQTNGQRLSERFF